MRDHCPWVISYFERKNGESSTSFTGPFVHACTGS
jgi:hypothetical protein